MPKYMPKKPGPPKPGKFRIKYTRPDRSSAEINGALFDSGAVLLDMVTTAMSFGADKVAGLQEVLDRYAADCEKRAEKHGAKP